MMKIQKLFKEKILNIKELSPGYENHASEVWLVKTKDEEVIVRTSKSNGLEEEGPFWKGCHHVFGLNPTNVHALETVNNILYNMSCIKVPKILRKGFIDKEYLVLEKLEGYPLKTFMNQPKELLYHFGVGLAQIHCIKMNDVGNPLGTFRIELNQFHNHLINALKKMVNESYLDNEKILSKLPQIIKILSEMKHPQSSSYILVDMDPTQFLTNGKMITGLVDTEAYVKGPRELDLIALEYVLDKESAHYFIQGYQSILDIPDLTICRMPYRYLYRLIEIQGREDLDDWLNHPTFF